MEEDLMSQLRERGIVSGLGGAATGAKLGSAFGPIGTGIGAVGGGLLGFFGGGSDRPPQIDPIPPGKLEQSAKAGLIFGPGSNYNLGLMDIFRNGGLSRPQNNTGTSAQGINPNLRYRTTGDGFTPSGVDKGYDFPAGNSGGNPGQLLGDGKAVFGNSIDDLLAAIGRRKKPVKTGNILNAGILAGLTPMEQQLALQGVGREGFETGLAGGFGAAGKTGNIIDEILGRSGDITSRNSDEVENLRNFLSQDTEARKNFLNTAFGGANSNYDRAAQALGGIDLSPYLSGADAFLGQGGDIANRSAQEAFQNVGLGRNISNQALSEKDYVKNLLSQRFGKTDEFLNNLFSGVDPTAAGLIDDIFNTNVNRGQQEFTTGATGQQFDINNLQAQQAAEARGFGKESSAYVDAMRRNEADRQNRFANFFQGETSSRSQNLLGQLEADRKARLSAAEIANQGATSFASQLAPLLNASSAGLGESTRGIAAATDAGDLLSKLAGGKLAAGQLLADTGTKVASGFTNLGANQAQSATQQGQLQLEGSKLTQQGFESVIDRLLKGDTIGLDAMVQSGQLSNQEAQVLNQLAQTGLAGQEQGFNELMALFNLAKGNRDDKTKLDILNAYGPTGRSVGGA